MTHWIQRIVAAAVVVAILSGAVATQAAPPRPGTDLMDYYDYELWVRDTTGQEMNGQWFLWNTYDDRGNAEYVAYLFGNYGYETKIVRIYIFGFRGPYYGFP
ncbi:MAG: hypothetical protein ISR77_31935 [Pirellulaceae bacterium]|nr:hypothetical protein [Pirellulaceae bacterium]